MWKLKNKTVLADLPPLKEGELVHSSPDQFLFTCFALLGLYAPPESPPGVLLAEELYCAGAAKYPSKPDILYCPQFVHNILKKRNICVTGRFVSHMLPIHHLNGTIVGCWSHLFQCIQYLSQAEASDCVDASVALPLISHCIAFVLAFVNVAIAFTLCLCFTEKNIAIGQSRDLNFPQGIQECE